MKVVYMFFGIETVLLSTDNFYILTAISLKRGGNARRKKLERI